MSDQLLLEVRPGIQLWEGARKGILLGGKARNTTRGKARNSTGERG
jgi:hypothetical protein